MIDDLDRRRRRAAYRAGHRGSKEMDWLLGRYAAGRLSSMSDETLAAFERLLALPDPQLQQWILTPDCDVGTELRALIADLRAFHGLNTTT
jgi:antitoxin CptB